MTTRTSKGLFAPGVSGNPSGRPKSHKRLNDLIGAVATEDDERAIIEALVQRAKAGEQWAVKEYLDRQFGREPNRQQIASDADQTPIRMTIVHTVAAPSADDPDIIEHPA